MVSEVPERVRPVLVGGGIGAGKSSVTAVFGDHGYAVIVADEVGREVLAPGSEALSTVAGRWPEVMSDGAVDRQALAEIVFNDPDELLALESITHPLIASEIRRRLAADPERPAVVEVPVMGVLGEVEALRVAVIAPVEVRIARAVARGNRRDDVVARMRSQPSQGEWRAWADIVVENGGPWLATLRFVESLIGDMAADVRP